MRLSKRKSLATIMMAVVLVLAAVLSMFGGLGESESVYARTIETRDEMGAGDKIHFYMSSTGVLSWDAVPGAAKYRFRSFWLPGDFEDWSWLVEGTSYNIIGKYDELKRDTHKYRFEVTALDGSNNPMYGYTDYILYYYISPFLELGMPTNLRWDGKVARWDAVEGATEGYKVTLYDADGNSVGGYQITTNNYYDFSASVQAGYHFKVVTNKTATHRGSNANDSDRYTGYSLIFSKMGSEGHLNFRMSEGGNLEWDEVPGATGYEFETHYWPGDFKDLKKSLGYNEFYLVRDFGNRKLDTGWYRVLVKPQGVSGYDDEIMYYYVSPYDKLATPTNLDWDDKTAKWDEVEDAWNGYKVTLYDLTGETMATYETESTEYDFSGDHLGDGWTFSVSAKSTLLSRGSDAVTSLEFEPYTIESRVYDATLERDNSGGEITVETNHGGCAMGYGCYASATNETNVTMKAYPYDGYRFVAWKVGGPGGQTLSTDSTYTFSADSNIRIIGVFRDASEVHTVTFNSHGGSGVPTQTVPFGMPATEPEPTWDGHVFMGWYTEAGYENRYDFRENVEADITLHAKWAIAIPSVNILIDEPEEGGHPDFTLVAEGQHYTVEFREWQLYSSELDYPTMGPEDVFEYYNYYCLGYYLEADEGYAFPSDTVYTVNGHEAENAGTDEYHYIRYIFQLMPEVVPHTLHFEANGGSGEMEDVTGLTGIYTLPDCQFYPPANKRFEGWSENPEGDITTYVNMTDVDRTVYAIWEDLGPVIEHYINAANVLMDVPVAGEHPDTTLVADGEHYTVEIDDWIKYDEPGYPEMNPEEEVFQSGRQYQVSFRLYTDEGYGFADDAYYTVNGRTAGRAGGIGATYVYVRYNFRLLEEGEELEVTNRSEGNCSVTALPDGVKVTAEKACTVAITDDGGRHYKRIPAVVVDGEENTYKFSFTVFGWTEAAVSVNGDGDFDGEVSTGDSNLINRSLISDTLRPYRSLSALEAAIMDVDGDGEISTGDSNLINRSLISPALRPYKALEW